MQKLTEEQIARQVNNWGRWGDTDQKGCLNFIDAQAVARGVQSIRHNHSLSLALPLNSEGPQIDLAPGRINPERKMIALHTRFHENSSLAYNDDSVEMGLQAATHWDALAHCEYKGKLYNGYDAASVTGQGARYCGIEAMGLVQTRGCLLDIAKLKNRRSLPAGYQISNEDLDEAAGQFGVTVQSGDIVLIRTGQMNAFLDQQRDQYIAPCAGLIPENALWFHRHNIAAVATDNYVFDALPFYNGETPSLHRLCLVEMGLCQGQNWNMEELSIACERYQQYSFFLTASPEPFTCAVGAPVVPVVTM
jgi:kynurenine formamidase